MQLTMYLKYSQIHELKLSTFSAIPQSYHEQYNLRSLSIRHLHPQNKNWSLIPLNKTSKNKEKGKKQTHTPFNQKKHTPRTTKVTVPKEDQSNVYQV